MPDEFLPEGRAPGRVDYFWMFALLIILIAAVLRWFHLSSWDMWTDEVQTLWIAQTGNYIEGPMYSTAPINFWLTRASVLVFGPNELGERFPSFLSGVLSIAVFAWGFRRWLGDGAALLGALLLAIDPWHVGWSQTGRHFAPQMLFVLLGAVVFIRGWVDRRPLLVWTSAVSLLAAVFTHSSSVFFVGTFLVFLGIDWMWPVHSGSRRPRREYLLAAIPIVAVLLAYMPVFLGIGNYLIENKIPWNPPWNIVGSLAFYIMPTMAGASLAGIVILRREGAEWWALPPLLVIVPTVLILVSSMFTIASAAYLLSFLPFGIALAATTLQRIVEWSTPRGMRLAAVLLVAGIVLARGYELAHYYTVYNGFKPRWKDATEYVLERKEPGESFYASEGDVPEFYGGRGVARWISDATMSSAPEPGAWYAVYSAGVPFRHDVSPRYREISRVADLVEVFPVQYGAKNRTIAVFHTPSVSQLEADDE